MTEDDKRTNGDEEEANDPKTAPVDGPGGAEEDGGLGATSQGSPGEVEGGGTSGV